MDLKSNRTSSLNIQLILYLYGLFVIDLGFQMYFMHIVLTYIEIILNLFYFLVTCILLAIFNSVKLFKRYWLGLMCFKYCVLDTLELSYMYIYSKLLFSLFEPKAYCNCQDILILIL